MRNLKRRQPDIYSRQKGDTFEYRDKAEGNAVEVRLAFSEGGTNFATYKKEAKGLYVHLTPMHVEIRNGMVSKQIGLFGDIKASGAKVLVLAMARRNAKALDAVAERLDPIVPELCTLFRDDPAKAFNKIVELFPVA
jgi:hypothetical protein